MSRYDQLHDHGLNDWDQYVEDNRLADLRESREMTEYRFGESISHLSTLEEFMDINTAFPSAYLKAADLKNHIVKVIMDRVEKTTLNGDEVLVLSFRGKDKGLVLNKTNANAIAAMHGSETDNWSGMEIKLCSKKVEFQGRYVDAIRVSLEEPPQPQLDAETGDEIPF